MEESIRYYSNGKSAAVAFCFPEDMTARKYGDVFVKYASRKGTDTSRLAIVVVREAFEDAFSCSTQEEPAAHR